MEDAIEICSGCGKLPRSIDTSGGLFVCIRCGNKTTIHVSASDYEKIVTELDARFHTFIQRQKIASAMEEPILRGKQKKARAKAAKPRRKAVKKGKKKPQKRR
jgi:hypothetical protein